MFTPAEKRQLRARAQEFQKQNGVSWMAALLAIFIEQQIAYPSWTEDDLRLYLSRDTELLESPA